MLTQPQPSDLARAEWQNLLARGIKPTLDETAAFLFWSGRVEHPDGSGNLLLESARATAGTDVLRPLSVQAEMWLEWLGDWAEERLLFLATAFAAAVGREQGVFEDLRARPSAAEAVAEWAAHVTCSAAELADALEVVVPGKRPTDSFRRLDAEDDSAISMRDILAELAIETAHTAEWWLTQSSDELLRALHAVHRRQARAVGAAVKFPDASAEAMQEFLAVLELINRRHAEETEGDAQP